MCMTVLCYIVYLELEGTDIDCCLQESSIIHIVHQTSQERLPRSNRQSKYLLR